jgi:hypothetical protein
MAQADDADIIAAWPPEGVSLRESLRRAPGWPEYEKARAKSGFGQSVGCYPPKEVDALMPSPILSACMTWIRDKLQSGVLVLMCLSLERPFAGPERMTFPAATTPYLDLDWDREIVLGPNKATYFGPIIRSAASMPPTAEPQQEPSRGAVVSMPSAEVRSTKRVRRKTVRSKHDRLAAVNHCAAYLERILKASPERRSHTNRELRATCREKHKVNWREYQDARKIALDKVPEARAAWTKSGPR